jgi:plastocyanin
MKYLKPFLLGTFLLACMSLAGIGCGGGGGGGGAGAGSPGAGQSVATILFDSGAESGARFLSPSRSSGSSEVDPDDIESLILTVTEIVFLHKSGDGLEDDDEDDIEDGTVLVNPTDFAPNTVTIDEGETVRWVWTSDGFHTVTSGTPGDPFFGSQFNGSGSVADDVVEISFSQAGVYPYFSNNPADIDNAMTGTVIVEEEDEEESDRRRDDDEEDEHENEDDDTTPIVVFTGSLDIDVVDLTLQDLTELISEVVLPSGEYKGIRLTIENPRLVLKSDPDTVITDVHLTAGGRLFIKYEFTLAELEEILVTVHFGGIHLIQTGSGKYVLTPHLTVSTDDDEPDEPVKTHFEGVISSIADDYSSMVVAIETRFSSIEVILTPETDIFEYPSETWLTPEDLAVDQEVKVFGFANDDSTVTAYKVKVFVDEPEETRFEGVITEVGDGHATITVDRESRSGGSVVVHVTGKTVLCFYESDLEPMLEDLQVGVEVKVFGVVNDDDSVTASKIKLFGEVEEEPEEIDFDGVISFIAEDLESITVNTVTREASVVVQLTGETKIFVYGSHIPLDPQDLEVEMSVIVIGVENLEGGVTASIIKVVEHEEESTD